MRLGNARRSTLWSPAAICICWIGDANIIHASWRFELSNLPIRPNTGEVLATPAAPQDSDEMITDNTASVYRDRKL